MDATSSCTMASGGMWIRRLFSSLLPTSNTIIWSISFEAKCSYDATTTISSNVFVYCIKRSAHSTFNTIVIQFYIVVRESCAIPISSCVFYTDNSITSSQIREMELIVLLKMRWQVLSVTAYDFLRPIMHRIRLNADQIHRVRNRSRFLVDISCLEESLIAFAPSILASACIAIRFVICCNLFNFIRKSCIRTSAPLRPYNGREASYVS